MREKLNNETPWWKQLQWWWISKWKAWPISPEMVSASFDFNSAPFYQSFVEVQVEVNSNNNVATVRVIPYGANGQLTWKDLHVQTVSVPSEKLKEKVEFVIARSRVDYIE